MSSPGFLRDVSLTTIPASNTMSETQKMIPLAGKPCARRRPEILSPFSKPRPMFLSFLRVRMFMLNTQTRIRFTEPRSKAFRKPCTVSSSTRMIGKCSLKYDLYWTRG